MEALNKTNKLIAIYARVSTARQEEEGTIATQLSAVKDFADKNGYTIVQEYKDDGWSGDIIARPALDQLRLDAKKKIWEAVLFYDPDRLARRYSYQELVMDELRELGIEPLFVTIPPSKNSEDKLLYGVRGIFAEYERIKIAERFRFGKVRKAKEGHIILAEAPYGYDFVPKTPEKQGYIKINETEAKVMRDVFSWVADEEMTLRNVVRRLQTLGIKPRKSKRGVWNTSTLSTLLRNRTLIGEAHYGASYATVPQNPIKKDIYRKIKKTSRKMKPMEEWIIIKTPAIIDRDLFERVQQQLKRNLELCERHKKNDYLLAGKIWCSCGQRRTGEGPMHGKHLYYRCSDRIKHYPFPRTCMERGLDARIADEKFWRKIAVVLTTPTLIEKNAKRFLALNDGKEPDAQLPVVDIDWARKQIAKLKIKEDRYAKAYGEGVFSMEQYKKYVEPIRQEIASFEEKIAKAQLAGAKASQPNTPTKERIAQFCKEAGRVLREIKGHDLKKAILKGINIKIVGDKLGLRVNGHVPVNYFNYVEFKSNYRYCWPA